MSDEDFSDEDMGLKVNPYKVKNSIDNIFKNCGIAPKEENNNSILKEIENFHNNLNIYSPGLLTKIKGCFEAKKIDFQNIKKIAKLAVNTSTPKELNINLEQFYDFIFDDSESLKKENVDIIFGGEFFHETTNFIEILKKMKFEVFTKQLGLEKDEYFHNTLRSCIELNWNIVKIIDFFYKINPQLYPEDENSIKKDIEQTNDKNEKAIKENQLQNIKINNEKKKYTLDSLFDIINAYPTIELEIIEKINFENPIDAVRDFYIECSIKSVDDNIKALSTRELLDSLYNLNKQYFSIDRINEFEEQIKICNSMKNVVKSTEIKKWIEEDFKKLDFNTDGKKNKSIAKTLGVISIGLYTALGKYQKEKFYLRDSQILAILIFIDNHGKNKGIIEEISTGEGKSAIISCLAAYFGLRGYKVDIITSSKTLAERDANKFKKFYSLFGLSDDNCRQYEEAPYKANIVYGTFLDFEGDLLDEISSGKKIRGDRKFEIIIIDEVDNMFIDGIEGSTQLTHSSKGYQYLIPMYLSIYLFVDILDHLLYEQLIKQYDEIINKENYKNLSEESKKKILNKIHDVSERKNTFIEYIEKCFKDILKELEKKNPEYVKKRKQDYDKALQSINNSINQKEDVNEDESKLNNSLQYPKFLDDFVKSQLHYWINNAYYAKHIFKKEKDYTISSKRLGYDCITPIDRKNTGELELNTVYRNGLHQMLQIKENIRVQSETLTHTFLSHVTYFQKFKKGNFFGLTGTIGGEETNDIYKNDYFNSNLVYIPQYKKKRFINLPPKLFVDDYEAHMNEICKEIIYQYSRGRKILIICKDIDEGENIKNKLKEGNFDLKKILNEIDENYKNDIFLYLRNDKDNVEKELRESKNRIIISTNLGGRGTDIDTTPEVEEKGGLHVIITKLSSNSRTQKQAFGRTSRQGKKGSGQYILLSNKNIQKYGDLIKIRDEKEKKRINSIDLGYLILKDELFIKYITKIKNYKELKDPDDGYYLKSDIDERWSFFLKKYVNDETKINEKIKKEINDKFNDFMNKIDNIMKLPRYKRFNNNFLRISEGVRVKHRGNDKGLNRYLDFEGNEDCFYFSVFYYKAIIEHSNYLEMRLDENPDEDIKYCEKIIHYFKKTKEKLDLLIEVNIDPVLKSFQDWEQLSKLEKFFKFDTENNYHEKNFYKQFLLRKNLIIKLKDHIDRNIDVINQFIQIYSKKNTKNYKYHLDRDNVEMEKELNLDVEEAKNLDYFADAAFYDLFKFKITKPIIRRKGKFWLILLGYYLLIMVSQVALSFIPIPFVPAIILGIENAIVGTFVSKALEKQMYLDYVDIHENNSMFSIIKRKITSIFKSSENEGDLNKNINNQRLEVRNTSVEDDGLKREELENMKIDLIKISNKIINQTIDQNFKTISEEIKFLLLIDKYNNNRIWNDKIMNIIRKIVNNSEIYLEKYKIIRCLNKKSKYNEGKKMLTKLIVDIIINIVKEIKNDFSRKEYNEKEGLTCLEHIIIKSTFGKMDNNTSSEIVNQILSNNIIDKNYLFNKSIFKNMKSHQNTRIYYKIDFPSKIQNIKNFENLKFNKTFDIPIESDPTLKDLQLLYLQMEYKNVGTLLFIDYTNKIKNILSNIFQLSCEENNVLEFNNFISSIKNRLNDLLEAYLKEDIYPNILININRQKTKKLNKEEEEVLNRITEISGEKAFKSLKSEKYRQFIFN